MKRISLVVATGLMTVPLPAGADDLGGRWSVMSRSREAYEGVILIDAEQRVTWNAPDDNGRPARFLGYIQTNDATGVRIVLTNRKTVVRVDCATESSDLLRCRTTYADGSQSIVFALTRVGPPPARLRGIR